MSPVGVIGAGAWGTALAQLLAATGRETWLWARDRRLADRINVFHENEPYLSGRELSPLIRATANLTELANCSTLLVVTPAQAMREVLENLVEEPATLVLCCKGIEASTHLLMSEVAADIFGSTEVAVLSGPTFAAEVASGMPTAATVAHASLQHARNVAGLFARTTLRPYASSDVVGAEIGGAVKNVLAIACGVVEGAGLGQNARAALIARGFAEMTRFGLARGARAETLAGLSGLGDLVLTCSSTQSRNFSLGVGIGRGEDVRTLLANRITVAEGAATAPVLAEAAAAAGVDMPVTTAVCALLRGASAREVIGALLARPLRSEQ